MILGLTIAQFTLLHVAISIVGILAGLVAVPAFAAGRYLPATTGLFLVTTLLTSLTGFLFPISAFTPALGTGIVATLVLIPCFAALYGYKLKGWARAVYAVTATVSLYLNMFVLVVQSFLKVPALNALAPTGTEPAFLVTQSALLVAAVVLGWLAFAATRGTRPVAV